MKIVLIFFVYPSNDKLKWVMVHLENVSMNFMPWSINLSLFVYICNINKTIQVWLGIDSLKVES